MMRTRRDANTKASERSATRKRYEENQTGGHNGDKQTPTAVFNRSSGRIEGHIFERESGICDLSAQALSKTDPAPMTSKRLHDAFPKQRCLSGSGRPSTQSSAQPPSVSQSTSARGRSSKSCTRQPRSGHVLLGCRRKYREAVQPGHPRACRGR